MSPSRRLIRRALIVVLAMVLCPRPASASEAPDRRGQFVRVFDPANIIVKRFNAQWTFTLLGVRPIMGFESPHPVEHEARRFLTTKLRDQRLTLVLDKAVPSARRSRSFTGYAYLEDGTCLNELLLALGYGAVDDSRPFARLDQFRAVQREAQAVGTGVWSLSFAPGSWESDVPCADLTNRFLGACGLIGPDVISEARVIPSYPRKARRNRVEGRVVLLTWVTKDGEVAWAIPSRSADDGLSVAATEAISRWRFHPPVKDGRVVEVDHMVVVDFVLLGK